MNHLSKGELIQIIIGNNEQIQEAEQALKFYKETTPNGKIRDFYYNGPTAKRAEDYFKKYPQED